MEHVDTSVEAQSPRDGGFGHAGVQWRWSMLDDAVGTESRQAD
jgi:hypothetical protein